MNGLTLGGCLLQEQSGDEISLTFIGCVFIQSLVTRTEGTRTISGLYWLCVYTMTCYTYIVKKEIFPTFIGCVSIR